MEKESKTETQGQNQINSEQTLEKENCSRAKETMQQNNQDMTCPNEPEIEGQKDSKTNTSTLVKKSDQNHEEKDLNFGGKPDLNQAQQEQSSSQNVEQNAKTSTDDNEQKGDHISAEITQEQQDKLEKAKEANKQLLSQFDQAFESQRRENKSSQHYPQDQEKVPKTSKDDSLNGKTDSNSATQNTVAPLKQITDLERHELPAFTESVTQNDKVIPSDMDMDEDDEKQEEIGDQQRQQNDAPEDSNNAENLKDFGRQTNETTVLVQSGCEELRLFDSQANSNNTLTEDQRYKSNKTECAVGDGEMTTDQQKELHGIVIKGVQEQHVRLSMNDNILVKSEDGHIRSVQSSNEHPNDAQEGQNDFEMHTNKQSFVPGSQQKVQISPETATGIVQESPKQNLKKDKFGSENQRKNIEQLRNQKRGAQEAIKNVMNGNSGGVGGGTTSTNPNAMQRVKSAAKRKQSANAKGAKGDRTISGIYTWQMRGDMYLQIYGGQNLVNSNQPPKSSTNDKNKGAALPLRQTNKASYDEMANDLTLQQEKEIYTSQNPAEKINNTHNYKRVKSAIRRKRHQSRHKTKDNELVGDPQQRQGDMATEDHLKNNGQQFATIQENQSNDMINGGIQTLQMNSSDSRQHESGPKLFTSSNNYPRPLLASQNSSEIAQICGEIQNVQQNPATAEISDIKNDEKSGQEQADNDEGENDSGLISPISIEQAEFNKMTTKNNVSVEFQKTGLEDDHQVNVNVDIPNSDYNEDDFEQNQQVLQSLQQNDMNGVQSKQKQKRKVVKRKVRHVNADKIKQVHEFVATNGVQVNILSTAKDPLTGAGQLIYPEGSVYIGEIRKGIPHGQGEKIFPPQENSQIAQNSHHQSSNQNIVQNQQQETEDRNQQVVGDSQKSLPKDQAVSSEKEDQLTSQPFQKTYKGNWHNGQMNGFGELSLAPGEVYIGDFQAGFPHGRGIRKWDNGDFYEGDYAMGYQTGQGLFLSLEQGWKYIGQWQAGKMTGEGSCQWRDGTMYTGQWQNCIKQGPGVLTYADGSQVECYFVNDFPEGFGKKIFADKSVYVGSFKAGLFHGQGRYRQPSDGSEYSGSWIRNEIRGEGVKKLKWGQIEIGGYFHNGQITGKGYKKWRTKVAQKIKVNDKLRHISRYEYFIYRGNLQNSQIEGFGEFKWPDGRHYIGDFVNAQMHGQGKMSWIETSSSVNRNSGVSPSRQTQSSDFGQNGQNKGKQIKNSYKGQMYANVIQGFGTLKRSNGDSYVGEFTNAVFQGEGTYLWANKKLRYKGQFREGKLNGYGVLHAQNGIYEGEFKSGLMHGTGLMVFYNGDKYSGEFSNSQMTGYGCYTLADETKMIGHFQDGVCNKHAKKIYPDGRMYVGEFVNDVENGKGILIDGQNVIKGIWKDSVLVKELVQKDVNYENSIALNQYDSLQDKSPKNKQQETKEIILPQELNPREVAKKKDTREVLSKDAQNLLALKQMQSSDPHNTNDESEKDQDGKHWVEPPKFDEAQFDMDPGGREYLEIEYMSGDMYKGELQGENRHGLGMFTYKRTGEKVMGNWKNNFLLKKNRRHPEESLTGELVPLSITKYEGRSKKES